MNGSTCTNTSSHIAASVTFAGAVKFYALDTTGMVCLLTALAMHILQSGLHKQATTLYTFGSYESDHSSINEVPQLIAAAGNGVIVHASDRLGLVVVDRSTVPVGGGNITLSFGAYPDELPGRVRFLHPLHNFAIISYDPTQLSHQVSPSPPPPRVPSLYLRTM